MLTCTSKHVLQVDLATSWAKASATQSVEMGSLLACGQFVAVSQVGLSVFLQCKPAAPHTQIGRMHQSQLQSCFLPTALRHPTSGEGSRQRLHSADSDARVQERQPDVWPPDRWRSMHAGDPTSAEMLTALITTARSMDGGAQRNTHPGSIPPC